MGARRINMIEKEGYFVFNIDLTDSNENVYVSIV